jgi:hypothetical protein
MSDNAMRGRVGAYKRWAATDDRTAATAPARSAFLRRFETEVDPDGRLTEAERARRAYFAMRAYMADLSRRRVASRRRSSAALADRTRLAEERPA